MADAADETGPDGEDAPKGRGKKKLVMIAGALVLLLGGAGAFFMLGGEEAPAAVEGAAGAPAEQGPAATAVYLEMPSLLVNLASEDSRETYLRVAATLELGGPADLAEAKKHSAAIMDGFQAFLREMRPRDIAGSGGLLRLKEELLVRANAALGRQAVENVLLTEFLVQ